MTKGTPSVKASDSDRSITAFKRVISCKLSDSYTKGPFMFLIIVGLGSVNHLNASTTVLSVSLCSFMTVFAITVYAAETLLRRKALQALKNASLEQLKLVNDLLNHFPAHAIDVKLFLKTVDTALRFDAPTTSASCFENGSHFPSCSHKNKL